MNRTRRIGLAALAMALLSAAAGCAGVDRVTEPSKAPAAPVTVQPEPGGGGDAAATPALEAPPSDGDAVAPAELGGGSRIAEEEADERAPNAAPTARPGLGTEWGETRTSRISSTAFLRADPQSPFATAVLSYNDEAGARAMAGAAGFRRTPGQAFTMAGGAVSVGLRNEDGRFFSGFVAGDRSFVVGEAGLRYTIVLQNLTSNRLECVVSVDGLDVLDGQPASFAKRGYILDPGGELEIDGFRQSMDTVAAFRFGSVRGSYAAQKHGDTRNVGVIGVALFHERGVSVWTPEEIQRRSRANPFPAQPAIQTATP